MNLDRMNLGRKKLDRRRLLATGGACLASCGAGARSGGEDRTRALDSLLEAHAGVLPENPGAGANHYPMAAEALEALGFEDEIEDAWRGEGAALYPDVPTSDAPLRPPGIAAAGELAQALGAYDRFPDWLKCFRGELREGPWRHVLAEWVPRLTPGLSAGAFHGLIRTAHAARALRVRNTEARRTELAFGLAYWAARYTELDTDEDLQLDDASDLAQTLASLEHPWIGDPSPIDFFSVVDRLNARPSAPAVRLADSDASPEDDLSRIVRAAATGFLEMLVLEQHRLWLLHTVTGPAAAALLLPELEPRDAQRLVEYSRQAVAAMYVAFGAPFDPRAHVRPSPPGWPTLVRRAVDTRSVHTIKLTEALLRFDGRGSVSGQDDRLMRSAAAQFLEWV